MANLEKPGAPESGATSAHEPRGSWRLGLWNIWWTPHCPAKVMRSDCRGVVRPRTQDPYLLSSFSWSSCGSPVSCYSRLTLWTHFALEKEKRSKRGIRACEAGTSLQVQPITGHENSLTCSCQISSKWAAPGDRESDEAVWKVDRIFMEEEGEVRLTLGGWLIIWVTQLPGTTHARVPNHRPEWPEWEAPVFQPHTCLQHYRLSGEMLSLLVETLGCVLFCF